MFESKAILNALVARVLDFLAGKDRGDILATEDIERLTGCGRYTEHWGSIIKKLKREFLRARHITLWPVVGVGYKLSTHAEQLRQPEKRQRRATRQLTKSIAEVSALPDGEIDESQRRLRNMLRRQMIEARRSIKSQMRQQRQTAEESQTPTQEAGKFRLGRMTGRQE